MSRATVVCVGKPHARRILTAQDRRQGRGRTVRAYIGSLPATYRRKIQALLKQRGGYFCRGMSAKKRELLAECIFEVVNDLEHRHVNKAESKKPKAVAALFEAMNILYDDLRWNEDLKAEGRNREPARTRRAAGEE